MKKLWRIKYEKILAIVLIVDMIICWYAFLKVSNVNTLAIACISTFMTLIVALLQNTIAEFRQEVLKNWK